MSQLGIGLEEVRAALARRQRQLAQGRGRRTRRARGRSAPTTSSSTPSSTGRVIVAYRNGAPVRLGDLGTRRDLGGGRPHRRARQRQARGPHHHVPAARRQHDRDGGPRARASCRCSRRRSRPRSTSPWCSTAPRASAPRSATSSSRCSSPSSSSCSSCSSSCATLRATIIPSVAVPLSLTGTFAGMYLLGYSLDNLSLMALTISHGLRRRRRHRGPREHHALPGGGQVAPRGGAARRARDRLHRALDEHLARSPSSSPSC